MGAPNIYNKKGKKGFNSVYPVVVDCDCYLENHESMSVRMLSTQTNNDEIIVEGLGNCIV